MKYVFIILMLFFIIYVVSNLCKCTIEGLVIGGEDDCIKTSSEHDICGLQKCFESPPIECDFNFKYSLVSSKPCDYIFPKNKETICKQEHDEKKSTITNIYGK